MSTSISPTTGSRSKKLEGGRVRFVVYLPQQEAKNIEQLAEKTQLSQSSIIAKFYFQGKNHTNCLNTEKED